MELTINDEKMKEMIREIIIEMIRENREGFYEIVLEALEEIGMANAIKAGRKGKFASEESILKIIEG
ncbi:MAG: hypothetical protein KDH97_20470 [Calditrichaeota bacterium]|nr:hypothetical protein [Calditrichota bacterium]MCB0297597.1 hypothetical protein [Calditrichota bacterium]MCB0304162.1 hypothetical protein [Calditrichota bacterium]MCB0313599.1 hypothetical protein [Calditrichota bacterium]MCB9090479.1 hypothetical protein [Calditrichia bacterium]